MVLRRYIAGIRISKPFTTPARQLIAKPLTRQQSISHSSMQTNARYAHLPNASVEQRLNEINCPDLDGEISEGPE